jgi:hypothetical protein
LLVQGHREIGCLNVQLFYQISQVLTFLDLAFFPVDGQFHEKILLKKQRDVLCAYKNPESGKEEGIKKAALQSKEMQRIFADGFTSLRWYNPDQVQRVVRIWTLSLKTPPVILLS